MVVKHHTPDSTYARPTTDIDRNLPTVERDGPFVPDADEHGYRTREQPMGTKRHMRVVLMGAGALTLNFLTKAEEEMTDLDMAVYEKNKDFSWKIKLWTHYYSFSPEIWRYLNDIEEENGFIEKYIKLRHRIEHVQWDADAGVWRFRVTDLESGEVFDDDAEFFINAGGVLNNWKWPDVPGLKSFEGKLMHSAAYEEGYPLDGKKVAVIGAGSSGVQIVARARTPR